MAELLRSLNIPRVILLGHDWGGVIVYRIYYYHPEIVSHIMCICTSYRAAQKTYYSLEDIVKKIPNFVYQIGFINPQTEKDLEDSDAIWRFLKATHRGVGDPGNRGLKAIMVRENMMKSLGDQPVPIKWNEVEQKYYREQYQKTGMHGPCGFPSVVGYR